jgi:hypothetical protein
MSATGDRPSHLDRFLIDMRKAALRRLPCARQNMVRIRPVARYFPELPGSTPGALINTRDESRPHYENHHEPARGKRRHFSQQVSAYGATPWKKSPHIPIRPERAGANLYVQRYFSSNATSLSCALSGRKNSFGDFPRATLWVEATDFIRSAESAAKYSVEAGVN